MAGGFGADLFAVLTDGNVSVSRLVTHMVI